MFQGYDWSFWSLQSLNDHMLQEQTVLGVEAIMELQIGLGILIFTQISYANKKKELL
jgi:hypothetical protein